MTNKNNAASKNLYGFIIKLRFALKNKIQIKDISLGSLQA